MKRKLTFNNVLRALFILCISLSFSSVYSQKPVKVFILAGQSNMVGHGEIDKGGKGDLNWVIQNTKNPRFKRLADKNGNWAKRKDVFVHSTNYYKEFVNGPLTPGFGTAESCIGPELMFGNVMGDNYDETVFIIKTSWGGKSLGKDFLSPSAVSDTGYLKLPSKPGDTGYYYVQMLDIIYDAIENIGKYVPGYAGQGCQIVGFGWHQGWNDRCNKEFTKAYRRNMECFINDVRKDLDEPELPFVIATTSMAMNPKSPESIELPEAQKAMLEIPKFKGNVAVVDTKNFWREVEESPRDQCYHWNRNAESYCLIGESMGDAMVGLLESGIRPLKTRMVAKENKVNLQTPPMGWNSWNAFKKDIDENKIRTIADIMVSSGMRDAGYKYLVIDDAWMAADRDKEGRLVVDSVKFPGGIKAVADYVHSKGLKFGIYECRGNKTCQNLPGSFKHEQIDMNTFASWGVDYIKLDACFAENNGRLSSEDFAIYHDAILKSGRPMVLSISDFGQGAWAWGGKKYAQLWRTSMDIYPFINSVYRCAETSGGSGSSHPAFNGLGQFSGHNHWNDPDMLQIGNLKNSREDKVHFSLWSILAAPLMAGNDLRKISDDVKNILTAPEIIAVNQDPRGIQGYKVYDEDSVLIYNKPLNDGTTAVLMLNKGKKIRDIRVDWKMVGLSGEQPVRDLWLKKDLGVFKKSFTAENLGEHQHLFLKVGTPGSELLPAPAPLPEEEYTVMGKGTTYLSDIYYIMKEHNHSVYDKNYMGKSIKIDGKKFSKGLGCKGNARMMFKINSNADRFKAIVGLDEASVDGKTGRFKVLNEDYFGGKVLFDSGNMKKGEKKEIDIDVKGIDFLYLEFQEQRKVKGDVYGNWGDARVVSE